MRPESLLKEGGDVMETYLRLAASVVTLVTTLLALVSRKREVRRDS
jgi:hypothetical protein